MACGQPTTFSHAVHYNRWFFINILWTRVPLSRDAQRSRGLPDSSRATSILRDRQTKQMWRMCYDNECVLHDGGLVLDADLINGVPPHNWWLGSRDWPVTHRARLLETHLLENVFETCPHSSTECSNVLRVKSTEETKLVCPFDVFSHASLCLHRFRQRLLPRLSYFRSKPPWISNFLLCF